MIKKDIRPPKRFLLKTCRRFWSRSLPKLNQYFIPMVIFPVCNDCLEDILGEGDYNWDLVDKICQYADIPFIQLNLKNFMKFMVIKVFPIYAEIFFSEEFEGLGWGDYFKEFKRLEEEGFIEEELPGKLKKKKYKKLKEKWGPIMMMRLSII